MTRSSGMHPESLAVMRKFFAAQNQRFKDAGMREMQVRVDRNGDLDTAPSKPASVKLAQSDGGLTLLWKPAKDDHGVAAYRIYRDGKQIATVRGSTWFVDAKATGVHDYEVRAVDASGLEGGAGELPLRRMAAEQSAQQQAQSGADGAAGQAPNGSTQAAAGAGQLQAPRFTEAKQPDKESIALAWQPVGGAVAYGVYQDGKLIGHVTDPTFTAKITGSEALLLEIDAVSADGSRSARTQPIALRMGEKGLEAAPVDGAAQAAAPPSAPAAPDSSASTSPTSPAGTAPEAAAPAPASAAPASGAATAAPTGPAGAMAAATTPAR